MVEDPQAEELTYRVIADVQHTRVTIWHAPTMTDERAIVEQGYDAMADAYLDYMKRTIGDPRLRFLDQLLARLQPGSHVVDLGCGAGIPCTSRLADQHNVLGIDVSREQLRRAQNRIPNAQFIKADIAAIELSANEFDAVTAFYSLTHIPRDEHADIFRRIARWLKADGYLLTTLSARGQSDGIQDDFVGVPMYFSGYGPDTSVRLLHEAGFELVINEIVTMNEPSGESSFQWVLARKSG